MLIIVRQTRIHQMEKYVRDSKWNMCQLKMTSNERDTWALCSLFGDHIVLDENVNILITSILSMK